MIRRQSWSRGRINGGETITEPVGNKSLVRDEASTATAAGVMVDPEKGSHRTGLQKTIECPSICPRCKSKCTRPFSLSFPHTNHHHIVELKRLNKYFEKIVEGHRWEKDVKDSFSGGKL